ncbi:hypothetical protein [Parasynechococcus sp.]|uniref:hypothetical protein n=1 Tax=Parasynechococcus sp. TaxID=3101203 RepID=UPI003703FE6F
MGFHPSQETAIRYRGFLLLQHANHSWLVRPERSPMAVLPFRTKPCSLADVKGQLDERLMNHDNAHPMAS